MNIRVSRGLPIVLAFVCVWSLGTRHLLRASSQTVAMTVPSGWNLVADPNGVVPDSPAYTYQFGDTGYEVIQPGAALAPGVGYWIYTSRVAGIPLSAGTSQAVIRTDAGQWVMIGDPSGLAPADVSGADLAMTYDPRTGFQAATSLTLAPGQAAFVLSLSGADISITAEGTGSTATCAADARGSACPEGGACPPAYPVAITQDWLAHAAPQPGDPALQATILLCFNDLSQAAAAGYLAASPFRHELSGPVSVTTANIRISVEQALLETPSAFLARVQATGQPLCPSCDLTGATAVLSLQYGLENIDSPPTSVSTGTFTSEHYPPETSTAYGLLTDETAAQPVHAGFPVTGSVNAVFTETKFSDIDTVDWTLLDPLSDTSATLPQPHGPNVSFRLGFAGPLAGQIVVNGDSGVYPPVPCDVTPPLYPCFDPQAPPAGSPQSGSTPAPAAVPLAPSTAAQVPAGPATVVPASATPGASTSGRITGAG